MSDSGVNPLVASPTDDPFAQRLSRHKIAQSDLPALLALQPCGDGSFRNTGNERNLNDRVFGGQVLGQFMLAAAATRDAARLPTHMQMSFLHGPEVEKLIDFEVTKLQDGRRFSIRQVRAHQGERLLADGHVSFQIPGASPVYQRHLRRTVTPPEDLPDVTELNRDWHERIWRGGYIGFDGHPFIDFRVVDPESQLFPAAPGEEFMLWYRIREPMPDDADLHAAALAYLSDWWLIYVSMAPYLPETGDDQLYVASLNHSLWLHAPCRADEWLLFVARSPYSGADRALSMAHIFARDGMLVATVAQESLQTRRTES